MIIDALGIIQRTTAFWNGMGRNTMAWKRRLIMRQTTTTTTTHFRLFIICLRTIFSPAPEREKHTHAMRPHVFNVIGFRGGGSCVWFSRSKLHFLWLCHARTHTWTTTGIILWSLRPRALEFRGQDESRVQGVRNNSRYITLQPYINTQNISCGLFGE